MKKRPSILKILQALYYIQSKAPSCNKDRYNIVYLLKMIFFADRYHLRHWGCLATNDRYYVMYRGPVASLTKDILEKKTHINSDAVKKTNKSEIFIEPQEDDELSESFKKSLSFALEEFGNYSSADLSEISHYYPEWKKHETKLSEKDRRIPMDIRDFFDDPKSKSCFIKFNKNEDPFKDDKRFLKLLKEDFNERYFISR